MASGENLTPDDFALVGLIARAFREQAVETLLAGNDTGCFTTQQYFDAYCEGDPWKKKIMDLAKAEQHLRSVPDLVREVRPGVWAGIDPRAGVPAGEGR